MDRKETIQLLKLLEQFYPNRFTKMDTPAIEAFAGAWTLAFEPYDYEDVKAAAVEYVRHNKFFPDVADITGELVKCEDKNRNAGVSEADRVRQMMEEL